MNRRAPRLLSMLFFGFDTVHQANVRGSVRVMYSGFSHSVDEVARASLWMISPLDVRPSSFPCPKWNNLFYCLTLR
ncbi:hypothetical protein EDD85DRAFT_855413 [Armillaria nabsnona]|nr:hypothetical protein EDD85DRAFT_855413 [Armillaria nabsnona]